MSRIALEGVVERIAFRDDESLYTVMRLTLPGGGEVTAVGTMPQVQPGERVRLQGKWRTHTRYGLQFHVDEYESLLPATKAAIETYLSSGLIKGVGPKMAKRLVDAFGTETLNTIMERPGELTAIPGIGEKRAAAIADAVAAQSRQRHAIMFLQQLGVSTAYALRIIRRFGAKTVSVVKDNPYRLAEEVHGIGFKRADAIAASLHISPDSPHRYEAAVQYVLYEAADEGHTYLPQNDLEQRLAALDVQPDGIPNALAQLQGRGKVVVEKDIAEVRVYVRILHEAEGDVARLLLNLLRADDGATGVDKHVPRLTAGGLSLSDAQHEAVAAALTNRCLVITGGPGTGKTTVVQAICEAYAANGWTFELAAPTGRAAQRLTEATGEPARTIHRLLEVRHSDNGGAAPVIGRHAGRPLEADAIIIDEVSMVDTVLMRNLLAAVAPGTRLVLIGDEDQLASVGPGRVLADILRSETIPVARLTEVFRQAARSLIVSNAHRIKNGHIPVSGGRDDDFYFMEVDPAEAPPLIADLVSERLPNYLSPDESNDIQVLTPIRSGPLGVEALNGLLQQRVNPGPHPEVAVGQRLLRTNDKVMQMRNDYDKMVFNGDIGRLEHVDVQARRLHVAFAEGSGHRLVEYTEDDLDSLVPAYAISVHKSQGSEYACVVMPMHWIMPALMTRQLLYTALTRARRLAVFVGNRRALAAYVGNERTAQRHAALAERLQKIYREEDGC